MRESQVRVKKVRVKEVPSVHKHLNKKVISNQQEASFYYHITFLLNILLHKSIIHNFLWKILQGSPLKFTGCFKQSKIMSLAKWPQIGLRRKILLKYDN